MVSTFTANKSFEQPARGDYIGTWDTPVNANITLIDLSLGGVITIPVTNSPVTLSSAQYPSTFLKFTGSVTANIAVTLPPVGSFYTIINDTTSSNSYYLTFQTTVAGGRAIAVPCGNMSDIMTDGTHTRFRSLPPVGSYWDYAGSSTPAWVSACTIPPYLYCNGTTFSSITYPALAALFNGTTLPDCRGSLAISLNDGSTRIVSSLGGVDGNTIFATGGNQSIALSSQHLPNTTFAVTDPGHVHTITHNAITGTNGPEDASSPGSISNTTTASITINSGGTNITVGTGGSGTAISTLPPTQIIGIRLVRAA